MLSETNPPKADRSAGKKIFNCLLLLSFSLLLKSCNTTEPPEGQGINLKLEDASCTEAWITLTTTNLQLPAEINFVRTDLDGNTKSQISILSTQDSLLYIDSLLPNTSYQYQVSSIEYQVTSNQLQLITLDTTSHSITWQVLTFGEHSHSRLNDVAIVGDEIWAVGEIYMNDTLGQPDTQPYAVAHWDGSNWFLMKVPYHDFNQTVKYPGPLFSVSYIDDNIYVVSYANLLKWAGFGWEEQAFFMEQIPFNGQVQKILGINENKIYCVGRNGAIYYYFGSDWQLLESGTDVNLYDEWSSNDETIWTCGYSDDYGTSALLRYSGVEWETVYEGNSASQSNGFYIGPISGVWGANDFRIYMTNWSGIYIQKNSNEFFLEKEIANFSDVGFGIDGTDDNNIFACGEGFVGHWNGVSYIEYPELYREQRTFYSVSIKGNTVCAVGSDYNGFIYSQAVIALGKIN